jgi:hypothetical protein
MAPGASAPPSHRGRFLVRNGVKRRSRSSQRPRLRHEAMGRAGTPASLRYILQALPNRPPPPPSGPSRRGLGHRLGRSGWWHEADPVPKAGRKSGRHPVVALCARRFAIWPAACGRDGGVPRRSLSSAPPRMTHHRGHRGSRLLVTDASLCGGRGPGGRRRSPEPLFGSGLPALLAKKRSVAPEWSCATGALFPAQADSQRSPKPCSAQSPDERGITGRFPSVYPRTIRIQFKISFPKRTHWMIEFLVESESQQAHFILFGSRYRFQFTFRDIFLWTKRAIRYNSAATSRTCHP